VRRSVRDAHDTKSLPGIVERLSDGGNCAQVVAQQLHGEIARGDEAARGKFHGFLGLGDQGRKSLPGQRDLLAELGEDLGGVSGDLIVERHAAGAVSTAVSQLLELPVGFFQIESFWIERLAKPRSELLVSLVLGITRRGDQFLVAPDATNILWRAIALPIGADRMLMVHHVVIDFLHPDFVLPVIAEIILVDELGPFPWRDIGKSKICLVLQIAEIRMRIPDSLFAHRKLVQVAVGPAHRALDHVVEILQPNVSADDYAPPDRGLGSKERDLQGVNRLWGHANHGSDFSRFGGPFTMKTRSPSQARRTIAPRQRTLPRCDFGDTAIQSRHTLRSTMDTPKDLNELIRGVRMRHPRVKAHFEDDLEWWNQGLELIRSGKLVAAENKFQKLMLSQPEHPDGYRGLAMVYEKTGRLAEACILMDHAVSLTADFVAAGEADVGILERMKEFQSLVHGKSAG